MKLKDTQIRQGDVLLVRTQTQDASEAEAPSADGSTVLAHGEVTGHRHRFERASDVQALTGTRVRQLIANLPAQLLHEEHTQAQVKPGIYDLPAQVEWTDANEPRRVED